MLIRPPAVIKIDGNKILIVTYHLNKRSFNIKMLAVAKNTLELFLKKLESVFLEEC
jgi:hypothetical protein